MSVAEAFSIEPLRAIRNAVMSGRYGLSTAVDGGFVVELMRFPDQGPITVVGYTVGLRDRLVASVLWLGLALAGALLAAHRRR